MIRMADNSSQRRRTFLKLVGCTTTVAGIGSSGAAAGVGSGGVGSSETTPAIEQSEIQNTTVSVRNLETDDVSVYESVADVDPSALPAGEYEVIERAVTPTGTEKRRELLRSQGRLVPAESDEFDVVLEIGDQTDAHDFDPYFSAGETIPIWVGAVEEEMGVPVGVSGIDLEVEIIGPDFETIETDNVTTDTDGGALIEYDLAADAADGQYQAEVSHADGGGSSSRFGVGEVVDITEVEGAMTPGQETTMGIYATDGGDPISTDVEVSISGPDGEDNQTIQTDGDGTGEFHYTPETEGTYTFDVGGQSVDIDARELKARSRTIGNMNPQVGEPAVIEGHVFDGDGPAADLELELSVFERLADDPTETITTSTNQHGQFVAEWDSPDETQTYRVEIQTTDGQTVFSDISIRTNDYSDEEADDVDVDVSFDMDGIYLAPGETVTTEVEVTDGGSPLVGKSVTLSTGFEMNHIPIERVDLETDGDGRATTTVTVPDEVDDIRFYVRTGVTVDGEEITSARLRRVRRYNETVTTASITPGESTTVTPETTDIDSGQAYSNVDVGLFAARGHIEAGVFDRGGVSTGADGTADLEIDVPGEPRRGISVTEITAYQTARNWYTPRFDELSISYDGPTEVTRGESVSIGYGVQTTASNTATIAVFSWSTGYIDATIVDEGTTASFDLPSDREGDSLEVHITVVTADGTVEEYTDSISVVDDAPEPPEDVDEYIDEETDDVETDGLREAIDDWRDGEIDTDLLREVIDAWRSG